MKDSINMKKKYTDKNKALITRDKDNSLIGTHKATEVRPYKEFDLYVELNCDEKMMDENNWGEKELLEFRLEERFFRENRKRWTFDELFEYKMDFSNYVEYSMDARSSYFKLML